MTHAQQIDTELAALYTNVQAIRERLAHTTHSALSEAGAKFYYVTRNRRETQMTIEEAEAILAADIAANTDDDHGYTRIRGGYNLRQVRDTVAQLATLRADLEKAKAELTEREKAYTGWSRFFLVTSSKGHIHSSMSCSTCRFTTTFGWLPEMSGRTEADCVAEFGPTLCSVCFPSAPVEWTVGEITKAKAEKAAAK